MNSQFVSRVVRACKLDVKLYEEVEADTSATIQAAGVVALSSLAVGISAFYIFGSFNIVVPLLVSLVSWCVWSYLIYFVGAKLFPEPSTQTRPGELLRTIGFSHAPNILRVFGFNQDLMIITFYGCGVWTLVAMVIAVRQALDYKSTWRAIGVVVIVTLVQLYVIFKLGLLPSDLTKLER